MVAEKDAIGGKYKHFKGKEYEVFCIAVDKWGNQFVLYQQSYGDKSFWIRPYDMFFSKTEVEGETVKRFAETTAKRKSASVQINRLITLMQNKVFTVKNSENEQLYCITNIDETRDYVCIHPVSNVQLSGYLTEYELAARMGYDLLIINDSMHISERKEKVSEPFQLHVGANEISILKDQLNPCSIDLQIADSGFLRARRSAIDPQAIEHISNATSLWKEVRLRQSKKQGNKYFKLRPGQTVLTHTREKIRIPNDCAGKVEIKSTYARLSLNITSGDFCNPGYCGYFPLEITNFGKHTVIIHEGETMAQLMLIALPGPILIDYSTRATYKNEKGYDDGTPYTFWRERAIKTLRNTSGTQPLIEFYDHILSNISDMGVNDVNAFRERFVDTFLVYCQRHMYRQRFQRNGAPDLREIVFAYINREKIIQRLWSLKGFAIVGSILGVITTTVLPSLFEQFLETGQIPDILLPLATTKTVGVIVCCIIAIIAVALKAPKEFCTFTKHDVTSDIEQIRKKML